MMERTKMLELKKKIEGLAENGEKKIAPSFGNAGEIVKAARKLAFPEYFLTAGETVESELEKAYALILGEMKKENPEIAEQAAARTLESVPWFREMAETDIQAAYEKDPASKSLDEVALYYPGVCATFAYRIAHQWYKEGLFMMARAATEQIHRQTAIDIHPGAKIGKSCFIDHGTGIVVGETAEIGDGVSIYHGVTLGALAFERNDRGELVRNAKRHPTIEDGVTLYAHAIVLGGKTVVGKDSVIGGGVWIGKSVPPGSKIILKQSQETSPHQRQR